MISNQCSFFIKVTNGNVFFKKQWRRLSELTTFDVRKTTLSSTIFTRKVYVAIIQSLHNTINPIENIIFRLIAELLVLSNTKILFQNTIEEF